MSSVTGMLPRPLVGIGTRLRWIGGCAAFAACCLNGVWLACTIYLARFGTTATQVQADPGIFRLSLAACVCLTLLQIPIAAGLAATAAERNPVLGVLGGITYLQYVPLNLISYFLLGRLAPVVHLAVTPNAALLGEQIEIGGALASFGALPFCGYGLLGLGWCLLAPGLWGRGRTWSVTALHLGLGGLLSVVGAIGAFISSPSLQLCTMLGGVVSLPTLGLVAYACWRDLVSMARSVQALEGP